jgi:hypothetical protein
MSSLSNRLPTLAEEINEAHELAMQHASAAVMHGVKVGQLLLEAKDTVPHGKWLPWLRENVAFSERTAQAYMRVADKTPPEIRNGAADFSLRKALRYISGPRRMTEEDELRGLLQRTAQRSAQRESIDPTSVEWIRLIAADIHDSEATFHRLGICPGDEVEGFCTICDAKIDGRSEEQADLVRQFWEHQT